MMSFKKSNKMYTQGLSCPTSLRRSQTRIHNRPLAPKTFSCRSQSKTKKYKFISKYNSNINKIQQQEMAIAPSGKKYKKCQN